MFKVTRGQKYLFRVIGTGALYPWRISVDQHNLTMVAVDGFDITPAVAESFIITPHLAALERTLLEARTVSH
jgi:FtsP/CotA-like multicopper oxidase with cupredoxin domain